MDQSTVLDNQFEKSARRVSFPFSIRFWYVPILALLAQSAIIRLHGADVVPEVFLNPESTEGRPWGQPLKKPAGAPLNLG